MNLLSQIHHFNFMLSFNNRECVKGRGKLKLKLGANLVPKVISTSYFAEQSQLEPWADI